MSETALRYGAEFDDWDDSLNEYITPLHAAACTGSSDPSGWTNIIPYFRDKGYTVNMKDSMGRSPFLHRVLSGTICAGEVDAWVQAGADINATDSYGRNAFHLIARAQLERTTWNLAWDELYYSVGSAQVPMHSLIRAGCDPHHRDMQGHTPTMYMQHFVSEQLYHTWISVLQEQRKLIAETDLHYETVYSRYSCSEFLR